MIEAVEKEINGKTYRFQPLFLKEARKQFDKIVQAFGPAIAAAVRGMKEAGEYKADEDIYKALPALAESVGGAIEIFAAKLTPELHENLVNTFLPKVSVNNGDDKWPFLTADFRNMFFATEIMTEFKVLLWCLEVQYADFFGLLRRAIASAALSRATMKPNPSDFPKGSIGTSIE